MKPPRSHNVVIFGESGSGKSSIVNMIVGEPVAEVSSSPMGCTFKHKSYKASIENTHFCIYDTAGLNEGDQGRVPHWKAVHELYTLIRCLDSVSLLIYCMRGRIKENARANWILFNKVLCAEQVPIIAVVTGLEHEEHLDGKKNNEIRKALNLYGMFPKNVECIVSVRGRKNEHEELYNSSQHRLRNLIKKSYKRNPWSTETDDWIAYIYKTTYTTKLCFLPDVQVEFVKVVGSVVDELIDETGMKKDDSDKLKATLLQAEKKLKRKKNALKKKKGW